MENQPPKVRSSDRRCFFRPTSAVFLRSFFFFNFPSAFSVFKKNKCFWIFKTQRYVVYEISNIYGFSNIINLKVFSFTWSNRIFFQTLSELCRKRNNAQSIYNFIYTHIRLLFYIDNNRNQENNDDIISREWNLNYVVR